MLITLPLIYFGLGLLNLAGWDQPEHEKAIDWRDAYLRASLIWGATLVVFLEILSLFELIALIPLSILWLLATFIAVFIGLKRGSLQRSLVRAKRDLALFKPGLLLIAGGSILLLLVYIALKAPPNNVDSLQYHMSRVTHWAQNASIRHYPTAFEAQLWNPIWAEGAILQLRVLWGSDQVANLVQAFSLVGCLIGVSLIAKQLGADHWGQLVTMTFALSIPMGILQATSTQTDLVVAFWLICFVYYLIQGTQSGFRFPLVKYLGGALALGMLSKGTFYPYAVPFLLWLCVQVLIEKKLSGAIKDGAIVVAIVSLLNLGFWLRNIKTFGGPMGPTEWVIARTGDSFKLSGIVSRVIRNILLNFPTPWEQMTGVIEGWVANIENGLGYSGEVFDLLWFWNHEDLAGNPIHFLLTLLSGLLLLAIYRKKTRRIVRWYSVAALVSFLVFSVVITYDPFGVRYQLPFLMISAPMVGIGMTCVSVKRSYTVPFLLLVISIPWVLVNRTRPLIAFRESAEPLSLPCTDALGCTRVGSVLFESRSEILFANLPERRDEYELLTSEIMNAGCGEVGLRLDSHDPEYLWWWLLKAPQSGVRIESIYYDEKLAPYADADFSPCGIICTICGERTQLHGLQLQGVYGDAKLFLGSGFSPDEDGPLDD